MNFTAQLFSQQKYAGSKSYNHRIIPILNSVSVRIADLTSGPGEKELPVRLPFILTRNDISDANSHELWYCNCISQNTIYSYEPGRCSLQEQSNWEFVNPWTVCCFPVLKSLIRHCGDERLWKSCIKAYLRSLFLFNIYLFMWLCSVLVTAHWIFNHSCRLLDL